MPGASTVRIEDLDQLKFAGVRIPFESIRVRGGIREHVHEFPHAQGGAPEKLGRRLYEIEITSRFTSGLVNPELAYLWPRQLNELMASFEAQTTQDLQLPDIGTIKAYCYTWDRSLSAMFVNGATVTMSFREDQSEEFLVQKLLTGSQTGLIEKNEALQLEGDLIEPKPDIFDAINAAANSVRAALDANDLYGQLLEAKILGLLQLVEDADRRWDAFNDPNNAGALDALLALWSATVDLFEDVFQTGAELKTWTVPGEMSVAEISTALYGDTERAVDILNLNALDDPYAVPAGTSIRYYEA